MTRAAETTVAVTMPQLGETVSEGTVLRWLKQVGDTVDDQEPLLEIATDKVDTEVPSPGAGVLLEIVVGEDTTVAVGTVLAHLGPGHGPVGQPTTTDGPSTGAGDDTAPMPVPHAPAFEASPRVASSLVSAEPADGARPSGPRHRHSPRVRRLTREAGLDPDTLKGTGPKGRVTPDDVARAAGTDEVAGPATSPPTLAPSAAAAGPAGGAASPAVVAETGREVAAPGSLRSLRTIMVSADLTSLLRTTEGVGRGASPDDALVAVMTTQAVSAIRARPELLGPQEGDQHVVVLVRRACAERTREVLVEHAEELNADGILRRLLEAGTGPSLSTGSRATAGATLQFSEDDHVVVDLEDPGPGQVASIGFSRPSPRVVVVDRDGEAGIGIRQTAYVSVRFDQARLDAPVVRVFLRDLVTRLASA